MLENGKTASSGAASDYPNLTPFKPGQSGNPSGMAGGKRFAARYSELRAELEADGVPLTVGETVALEMATRLSLRTPKDDHTASQVASTVKRLLDPLYERRAKATKPASTALTDYLRSKAKAPSEAGA